MKMDIALLYLDQPER